MLHPKFNLLIFTLLTFLISHQNYSQVGIGTTTPHPSSILDITSTDKALLLPRVADTTSISSPINGMLIYDISVNCVKAYENNSWSDCLSLASSVPSIQVNCNVNGFTGDYYNGTVLTSSNKFSVLITNNSYITTTISFSTTDLVLGGVGGITVASVSPAFATFLPGQTQLVEYDLSGVPSKVGTLEGTWTKLSLNCLRTVSVTPLPISSLNCSGAINSGILYSGLTASSVSSSIPYTGGDGSSHSGQVVNSVGVTGLTATLSSGNFAIGSGSLTYTITGIPSSAGTAGFLISIGGQTCMLNLTVEIPPIASLDCAGATNSGTLYLGTSASGVSSSIPYTGGNGSAYAGQTISSTGVIGLTATLAAGNFAVGNGSLTYAITGTPSSTGTASFLISIGGHTCTLNLTVTTPPISSLNCAGATNSGSLIAGTAASGVSSSIPYSGGNGSAYAGQTVNSTGVTGLTATLVAGNFATGSGSLTYTITGVPGSSGTASFVINIGGQICTLTRTVIASIVVPNTITLAQNRRYFIISIYDQDFWPYTLPTAPATTNVQAADGVNEAFILNRQGSLSTTGVTVSIPVTATGSGTLPAYTTTINVPASLAEDGISRDLQFSWASQTYTASTTSITATIRSLVGTFNAKKLDVNAGIGNDVLGVLLGTFIYPYNNAGNTTTYEVRDISALPDRNYNDGSHNMLYLPQLAEDGNFWLNHNLGASYTNTSSANFNPGQQPTSRTDHLAYGSLFQWGRRADRHELVNWTSGTTATLTTTTTTTSNNPTHALFIIKNSLPFDWRVTPDNTLWSSESSATNPCPSGFRVPTLAEFDALEVAASGSLYNSVVMFTYAGIRIYSSGGLTSAGTEGYYHTSTPATTGVPPFNLSRGRVFTAPSTSATFYNMRASGLSVRCIMN